MVFFILLLRRYCIFRLRDHDLYLFDLKKSPRWKRKLSGWGNVPGDMSEGRNFQGEMSYAKTSLIIRHCAGEYDVDGWRRINVSLAFWRCSCRHEPSRVYTVRRNSAQVRVRLSDAQWDAVGAVTTGRGDDQLSVVDTRQAGSARQPYAVQPWPSTGSALGQSQHCRPWDNPTGDYFPREKLKSVLLTLTD